ncbi:FMN-dependent NADH-azoreductase [Pseudonocardia zijingensis]|jgi:FMN-dependent NADH-azoreductase|uniref:FMN dependent NADH:quinone oxidoreductase n=1 Tax=Pseudonocardia zijingensis TaxID=153376 RepID=A0ABP4BGB6_9PSEU
MSLFRLDSSIRFEGSVTREVADSLERAWVEHHPDDAVVHRDLGADPLPADVWATAATAGFTPEDQQTPEQRAAVALATQLADELISADAAVIGVPLYNFGISQHVKVWIDMLIASPQLRPGGTDAPLEGKPISLVIARGGGYGPGTPRDGWDHATPYLRRIFGDVFQADVQVLECELTLADINPAMAELRDTAAALRVQANERAVETGRALAQRVAARAA